jgi:uncharacterized protein
MNKTSSLSGKEEQFRNLLEIMYGRVTSHPELRIREFAAAERFLLHSRGVRSSQATPWQQINVAMNGDFSTFSPELLGLKHPRYGDFILGNVLRNSFQEAESSDKFIGMARDINDGVRKCQGMCKYFQVCGGGAPSNKLYENGTFISSETLDCRLTKQAVTDVVLSGLERMLK